MIILAAMIRTLIFFSSILTYLPPFSFSHCLLFRVLVPYGCVHNPFGDSIVLDDSCLGSLY